MKSQLVKTKEALHAEFLSILDYWQKNMIDHEYGGFHGQIDHDNRVIAHAGKGAILNTRILWTFSAAYGITKQQAHLDMADRAFAYLINHFLDKEHGGIFWELDHAGVVINSRKQTYAQGFGIYGFSEYYRSTGNEEALAEAIALFEAIERHCHDSEYGGYIEALSREWHQLEDMRLSDKDENCPKSMNTHLHILEPYTNLYRVWKNDLLATRIRQLIRLFMDKIIDGKTGHFNLFFENDWAVKSDIISYGHDIEGAWLLTEAAEVLGDEPLLKEVEKMALKMTDALLGEGMNPNGSVNYELVRSSGLKDSERHWWPQAEALVGLLNAAQLSGQKRYLVYAFKVWDFIEKNLIDRTHGEWYWSVNKNGIPSAQNDKAGFWKCPYHNTRACMEGSRRLDILKKEVSVQ